MKTCSRSYSNVCEFMSCAANLFKTYSGKQELKTFAHTIKWPTLPDRFNLCPNPHLSIVSNSVYENLCSTIFHKSCLILYIKLVQKKINMTIVYAYTDFAIAGEVLLTSDLYGTPFKFLAAVKNYTFKGIDFSGIISFVVTCYDQQRICTIHFKPYQRLTISLMSKLKIN